MYKRQHYLNEKCEICSAESAEMSLSYRHSVFSENPDWVITDVTFSLNKGDREQIREKMNEMCIRDRYVTGGL